MFSLPSFGGAGIVCLFSPLQQTDNANNTELHPKHSDVAVSISCSYQELLPLEREQFPLTQMHFTIQKSTYLLNSYSEGICLIVIFLLAHPPEIHI